MTLSWIIVAVFVVVTWLPAGAVAKELWGDLVRPEHHGKRDPMYERYVLGWLYVFGCLIVIVVAFFGFVFFAFFVTIRSIWEFIKGGASGYWRFISGQEAEVGQKD